MTHTEQINNLKIVAEQFLKGEIEIKQCTINHPEEGEIHWFEYYNSTQGVSSSPYFEEIQQDILAECADAIKLARTW